MLTYFPTPYPGEWWWSALCRYHVRTGHLRSRTTSRELFHDRSCTAVGSLYPNSTILQVAEQLPGILDARMLMLEHTLFLYHTRCFTIDKKEQLMQKLSTGAKTMSGGIYRDRQLSSALRYCPHCVEDDRTAYGEAYWHLHHQIPVMEVCPKHGCYLLCLDGITFAAAKHTFYPLDTQNLASSRSVSAPVCKWQLDFSKILFDYATLPLSYAATAHSNLATTLADMGYEAAQSRSTHIHLDSDRLYHDLVTRFGADIVAKVFDVGNIAYQITQVCKWSYLTPERLALLQCFAGIDSVTVFSPERKPDSLERQLRAMKNSGEKYELAQLCELLHIAPSYLRILAKKYDISPFWKHASLKASASPSPQRKKEIKHILNTD